ncbi:MAG: NapC/NirT family cytochrome c [Planctomycetes bacterium]|nr:NapC/NirT family cytochrome c [Planctomycetota bacterium]
MLPGFGRRLVDRSRNLLGLVFVVGLFSAAAFGIVMYATVHHTAQPEFCNSCHIMEPYYESWQNSEHKNVACIECHYEPGSLETLEGKFKALSQLAKYVTRTQGTKPWAEVSDASCMRSGCHSVRMLDGPVMFGNISFDHRQHLLETRRGRRLRCTSCHSQIVQGQHVAVTPTVCVTCHFMPGDDGHPPAETSDCLLCHGPPTQPVEVEGRPFVHADYVERGVGCRECHNPVVEGDGVVRKDRCHACHAEQGHVERIGETAFLHEKHVTDHKVECFECHDEIRHGLLPLKKPEATKREGCGVCHESAHDAASLVYSGTGAVGVPDDPSRMYQTRVVCEACHTGRSGQTVIDDGDMGELVIAPDDSTGASSNPAHHSSHASMVAAAGNVDCIHCHGPEFNGMLDQWQSAVGEQLDRLKPMLADLEKRMPKASPAAAPLADAQRNLSLVALDGSRGVHNPTYALAALKVSAERLDQAAATLGVELGTRAADGFPFVSKDGCSECHPGAGRPASVWKGEAAFPHAKHLGQGFECSQCHSTTEHGKPAFPRSDCASCHHQETDKFDVSDCSRCHGAQLGMLGGALSGFAELKGPMSEMDCGDCHGEAPDILRPKPSSCVICHSEGFDQKAIDWKKELDGLTAELERELGASKADATVREAARAALDAVLRDGSNGAHNFEYAKKLLVDALAALRG